MAGFLYYLPEGQPAGVFLERRKAVFGDLQVARRGCVGPDGSKGALLIPAVKHPPQPRYLANEQTWREIPAKPDAPSWWIGYETSRRPGPDDLVRRNALFSGHPVTLEDGREWRAPVARFLNGATALPQSLGLNDAGELAPVPLNGHNALWERAVGFWDRFMAAIEQTAAGEEPLPVQEDWRTAVVALQQNYHIGVEEVGVLRILGTESAVRVLQALIDLPSLETIIEEQKKTEDGAAASSNTDSGATASDRHTARPAPTSKRTSGECD